MAHVAVSSSEGGVSELLLDDRYRYAFGHEFIGVGVTEPVRVNPLVNVSLVGETRQEGPYIGGFQWLALEGAEQGCMSVEPQGVSRFEPAADNGHRSRIKANDPSTVAFAVEHREGPCCRVYVFGT